jgi:hypothetical protein
MSLRGILLKHCTDQLALIQVQSSSGERALKRLLMLLSGLLSESCDDLEGIVRSHGSLGRGAEVTITIQGIHLYLCIFIYLFIRFYVRYLYP